MKHIFYQIDREKERIWKEINKEKKEEMNLNYFDMFSFVDRKISTILHRPGYFAKSANNPPELPNYMNPPQLKLLYLFLPLIII